MQDIAIVLCVTKIPTSFCWWRGFILSQCTVLVLLYLEKPLLFELMPTIWYMYTLVVH